MKNKKYKFVVVGGGTAGAIVSSYLKSYWGELIDVTVVYNHSEPNIGVGESLTPSIIKYLNYVGITKEEIIKYCNSTIKLGLKFLNWMGNEKYFYHPFDSMNVSSGVNNYGFESAYQVANNCYDNDTTYSNKLLNLHRLPNTLNSNSSDLAFALHIDGNLFSEYILKKFKNKLTIIDNIVVDIVKKKNNDIDYLICKNNTKIYGDFFIDASGFKKILFNKLENTWIDKSDWLPINRFIGNQFFCEHEKIPVCTTSEATLDGWILQVPLQNRWGLGYLFSSDFTDEEKALENFENFLKKRYNTNLKNNKILSFSSGYWDKQWIGNCICVGLSSGFAEPLEATNIHHVIFQIDNFVSRFNFKIFNYDITQYNEVMHSFYNRVYLFIRFCYSTGRTDSEFWNYLTNNTPQEVEFLEEKIKSDFLNIESMPSDIFNHSNFFKVANGLNKIDIKNYKKILEDRKVLDFAKSNTELMRQIKDNIFINSIDHKDSINFICNNYEDK